MQGALREPHVEVHVEPLERRLDVTELVQKSMGMSAGAFNTREFFHQAAPALLRRLLAEWGLGDCYSEQVCTLGNLERDPRGWSTTLVYLCLVVNNNGCVLLAL